MASLYTAFNNVVSDFLADMAARFPGNAQLAACLAFHGMACKASVRMPYEKFVEFAVVPYGDRLFAHDDAFFVDKSYDEVAGDGAGFVDAMKKLWGYMAEEDKQSVYGYLDLLLAIHGKLSGAS
jgi:hypothetical protein